MCRQNRRKLVCGFLCWWKTKLEGNCVFGKFIPRGWKKHQFKTRLKVIKHFGKYYLNYNVYQTKRFHFWKRPCCILTIFERYTCIWNSNEKYYFRFYYVWSLKNKVGKWSILSLFETKFWNCREKNISVFICSSLPIHTDCC